MILRQKKGILFWDIWAELLIQAAEKYKMNLTSLNTVREEQQLLIENLIENKPVNQTQNLKKSFSKSEVFFTSETFYSAMQRMKPLFEFLDTVPDDLRQNLKNKDFKKSFELRKNPANRIRFQKDFSKLQKIQSTSDVSSDYLQTTRVLDHWTRWSIHQSLTIQGRDTELFMELHPSKSFRHVNFLKTYLPAQEILGSLVCEIYAGLFQQKISKNILIVGGPGTTKSFFIQALAGETELKIVIDNAHRYSFVNGGVPIGMKLLREVFDSLSLHTPCLFVLEDIHIIGERRPMLISDDETSKTKENAFGSEQDEIHEKNKLIYQFSRHSFSHYKKPYKGDFSMAIPTNHFCYDLFLGIKPPRKRRSDMTPKSPLPLSQIENTFVQKEKNISNSEVEENSLNSNLLSLLQISLAQVFAPPATSPFNILLMKEQKKLKPKKIVKEMPWSGLSYDQYILISKTNSSVRVKVALLAELAMTNLSMKLDMITDLLVIVDSVRSNRGFVVFGTTHVPSLLDPALRRPGRFDETISLPLLPNLMTRFEIFKTKLSTYTETTDFFDLSLINTTTQQNENQIHSYLSKILLLLLNTKNVKKVQKIKNTFLSKSFKDYSIYSVSTAFETLLIQNSLIIQPFQLKKFLKARQIGISEKSLAIAKNPAAVFQTALRSPQTLLYFSSTEKLNYVSSAYSQAGQFLIEALLLQDQKTYCFKSFQRSNDPFQERTTPHELFKTLYNSKSETKNVFIKLFAGKSAEFFVFNESSHLRTFLNFQKTKKANDFNAQTKNFVENEKNLKTFDSNFQTNPSQMHLFENIQNFQNYWQSSLFFLNSFFQKRYLYNKNTIVSKLLFFEDRVSLRQSPSPPTSSILMPSKKFENYQRTLRDFIRKPRVTINEKLQIHQKQRFLKLLYNVPVQKTFRTVASEKSKKRKNEKIQFGSTNFYSSFKELAYLDEITVQPSSSSMFYQTRFLTRHRFSFLNQWWNGQLAEHTVEATYLSHVDWRSMFVQSFGDLLIDFPDADQYYNPRTRRWFLNSPSWNDWFDSEKTYQFEISQHYLLQTFVKTSKLFDSNREMFDYFAFRFLRSHYLKEIHFVQILTRFHKSSISKNQS